MHCSNCRYYCNKEVKQRKFTNADSLLHKCCKKRLCTSLNFQRDKPGNRKMCWEDNNYTIALYILYTLSVMLYVFNF